MATAVDKRKKRRASRELHEILIGGRFRIQQRVGGGAFGEVFMGRDVNSGTPVAFKMELDKDGERSHLTIENKTYRMLNESGFTVGIPQTYFCGAMGEYTIMVMDLLGPSLEELFNLCRRRFTPKTVSMIGIQIIERLQYVHTVGFLHRDIKPENFVMGLGDNSQTVYIIDVGLSKLWRNSSGQHVPYSEGRALTGTARYVSINTHRGIQQTRRDDLESVAYLLIYFLRGSLPWQGLRFPKSDTRYEHICSVKVDSTPESLVTDYPPQFGKFLEYSRNLEFEQDPDYEYCTGLLADVIKQAGEVCDYRFDWNCGIDGSDPKIFDEAEYVTPPDSLNTGANGSLVRSTGGARRARSADSF